MDTRMTLAALRVRMGYSQEEAAEMLGVSARTLRKWESDGATMPIATMGHIEHVYQYPTDDTFYGNAELFAQELRQTAVQGV